MASTGRRSLFLKRFIPYPDILVEGNSATFIYEDKVLLFAKITSPDVIEDENIVINAKAGWLECNQACLPGSADLSLSLNVLSSMDR
jgi:DsbC/DsbD-like thiol-disulfide interchange protein